MLELLTKRDEYQHILLNTLPTHGLAIAVLALFLALFSKSRAATVVALSLVFLCALSAWPVVETGESAYDVVSGTVDDPGQIWLDHHAQRADIVLPFFEFGAFLAALAILLPLKYPKSARPLALATFIASLALLGAGGWVAYAGGKIAHKEFRIGPPPPPIPKEKPDK